MKTIISIVLWIAVARAFMWLGTKIFKDNE
jgi:hypothetical protein